MSLVRSPRPLHRPATRLFAAWVLLACAVGFLGSVGGADGGEDASRQPRDDATAMALTSKGEAPPARARYESGPVRMTLTFDRSAMTTAQRLRVVARVATPEAGAVAWPAIGATWGDFHVVEARHAEDGLIGPNRVARRLTLVLKPNLPGDYAVPALRVKYTDSVGRATTVASEAVTVPVRSVLSRETLAEARAAGSARDLVQGLPIRFDDAPAGWRAQAAWWEGWLWPTVVCLLCGCLTVLAWSWARRRRIEPPLTLRERYRARLADLLRGGLLAAKRYEDFHQALSDLLRGYIEERFGLRAPERTTEEFLRDLGDAPSLAASWRAILARFLGHCDKVKFARHHPTRAEIEDAVKTVERFLDETRPVEDEGRGREGRAPSGVARAPAIEPAAPAAPAERVEFAAPAARESVGESMRGAGSTEGEGR